MFLVLEILLSPSPESGGSGIWAASFPSPPHWAPPLSQLWVTLGPGYWRAGLLHLHREGLSHRPSWSRLTLSYHRVLSTRPLSSHFITKLLFTGIFTLYQTQAMLIAFKKTFLREYLILQKEFMQHQLKHKKHDTDLRARAPPVPLPLLHAPSWAVCLPAPGGDTVLNCVFCISSFLKQMVLIHMHIYSILKIVHAACSLPALFKSLFQHYVSKFYHSVEGTGIFGKDEHSVTL